MLSMQRLRALIFVNMRGNTLNAKSVEALLFVNIGENAVDAKIAV